MLNFVVDGSATHIRRYKKIQKYLSHQGLRKEMETTQKDLYVMIERNFKREGTKTKKWARHKPSTKVARKERLGHYRLPHKTGILLWTGNLLASLTGKGPHAITRIVYGCLEMWLGTKHPLARLHHEGANFNRPPVSAKSGKTLRWFNPQFGTPMFASKVKSARITIPARPFWDNSEVKDVAITGMSKRIEKKVFEIWTRG